MCRKLFKRFRVQITREDVDIIKKAFLHSEKLPEFFIIHLHHFYLMEIIIGLIIIAIGAFCQSSSYVPINKIKYWSWESYWIVQGLFAWLILPFLGALLAVPEGHSLFELFTDANAFNVGMTILFGVLWGVGGLTFGLSMRYLGVALGIILLSLSLIVNLLISLLQRRLSR